MSELRINGLDELVADLEALKMTESKKAVARAVRAGAMVIREEAAQRAPRGETGRLADEIIAVVSEQTATEAIGKIGPSRLAYYGLFQEVGTAHHIKQPFLEPAFESTLPEAIQKLSEVLRAEIEKFTK